jgi:GxxExxY protein
MKDLDKLTKNIIGCAIEVHKELGPGLLESIYHKCLMLEFEKKRLNFETEKLVKVNYKGTYIDCDLRLDLIVEDSVIIELKSVKEILPIHKAQILTYMKLMEKQVGLLINFNVLKLTDGVKRLII